MKKSISLFLIVAMLFSMSSVAFAADNVQMEPELFEEYAVDTGIFYRYTLDYVGDEWDAIIFVPNDGSSVSFSATKITPLVEGELDEADDGIYSVTIEAGANKEPLEYLREGFSLLNQASVVSASTFDTNTVEQRDSVQADLFAAARKIYGNEYERVVYNDYTYPNVDVISVHEDLRQHRTIAEASAVESPIRQETIGFPSHFFARAHNFKPPGRACQPEADSPMRT